MSVVNYATFCRPPILSSLAAKKVAQCLIFEDPDECSHYRWDPVIIWQFETPQKKKKLKKTGSTAVSCDRNVNIFGFTDIVVAAPPPPWHELKEFRNWWWNFSILGPFDSRLRHQISDAIEQISWNSVTSEEEYVLFFLVRLCVSTRIEFGCSDAYEIPSGWCSELSQIVSQLGPFPTQKLTVFHDAWALKVLLTSAIQQMPHLQVLKINQWALCNDFMMAVGSGCKNLQDFAVPSMLPELFMSDEAFFKCFFDGMNSDEVNHCLTDGTEPRHSFHNLRLVDILYWRQTEHFLQLLARFYPRAKLCTVDLNVVSPDVAVEEITGKFANDIPGDIAGPFLRIGASVPCRTIVCRTAGLIERRLERLVTAAPFLRELRLHLDDNFQEADDDEKFELMLDSAGDKLATLASEVASLDSLVIRPHEGVDFIRILTPFFDHQCDQLTHLHLQFDFARMELEAIYQLVNKCRNLQRLVVVLPLRQSCSDSPKIKLEPNLSLNSLVLRDVFWEKSEEIDDVNNIFAIVKIATDVLSVAPNLEMFAMSMLWEFRSSLSSLASDNIHSLHFHFPFPKDDPVAFLSSILPNFRCLKSLSVEQDCDGPYSWPSLTPLTQSEVSVTRTRPEFAFVPKWNHSRDSSNTFNMAVM